MRIIANDVSESNWTTGSNPVLSAYSKRGSGFSAASLIFCAVGRSISSDVLIEDPIE